MEPDSDEVKAARQARLSKALSTAYLTHQITQLEDKVNHVQLNPQTRAFNPNSAAPAQGQPRQRQLFDDGGPAPAVRGRGGRGGFHPDHRGRGGAFDGRGRGGFRGRGGPPDLARGGRGRGGGSGRGRGDFLRSLPPDNISRDRPGLSPSNGPLVLPPSVESNVFPFTKPVMGQTPAVALAEQQRRDQSMEAHDHGRHEGARRQGADAQRVVVDASAMIWATPQIRRILKNGGEVIVPVECLRTLDIVKKGMSRVAVAARAATRFIEEAQRKTATPPSSSVGGPIVDGIQGLGKALRPGLWIQGDGEVVEIFPAAAAPAPAEGAEPAPIAPAYVKSTLQCALYYRGLWEVPSSSKILAVAHPPPAKGSDADATEGDDTAVAKFKPRTDGFEVEEWADKADIGCVVLAIKRKKREDKGRRDRHEDELSDELELGEEAIGVRQIDVRHGGARKAGQAPPPANHVSKEARKQEQSSTSNDQAKEAGLALSAKADVPAPMDNAAADIRALNAAQRARAAPSAFPPATASPKAQPAQPLKLTADALQQSQVAIQEMEQSHSPRLARPHVSPAVNVRSGSDFVPLKREEARRPEPVKRHNDNRGETRAPQSPRQAHRQAQGHRRPEPQPESVVPKMILLQRPKG